MVSYQTTQRMHRNHLPRSKITKLLVNLEVSVSLATMGSSILAPERWSYVVLWT